MQTLGRSRLRISRLLMLAALLAFPAGAATLGGTITYKNPGMIKELPLEQATVTVYNTKTRAKAVTVSSDRGAYELRKLAAGSYIVLVEKNGRRLYQGRAEIREPSTQFNIRL
jgi:hypothetical protein